MNEEAVAFFHQALEKEVPSIAHDGREKLIRGLLCHLFDHPWVDDEVKKSMIGNIACHLGLEIPEDFKEEE